MLYNLMNSNKIVAKFDFDDVYIEVIDNKFLPYELKDHIKTTEFTIDGIKKTAKDINVIRDFLASRTLNLSRSNAKTILNVASLPQSVKIEDRLKIVFACKGLTMTDNFWLKKDNETKKFDEVNLRKNRLSDVSYDIAILGKHISATQDELKPDLSTAGMFPKFWNRVNGEVYLYKTDKYADNISVKSELDCSLYLDRLGVSHIEYEKKEIDGRLFAVSKCIANDDESLIYAGSIKDWCDHTNKDFLKYIKDYYQTNLANMSIIDYVFANTDRHLENWGFIVDNKTNSIKRFAPLYDHNQALINDYFKNGINELIYEPLNMTFLDAAKEMYNLSNIDWSLLNTSNKNILDRIKIIEKFCNNKNIGYSL